MSFASIILDFMDIVPFLALDEFYIKVSILVSIFQPVLAEFLCPILLIPSKFVLKILLNSPEFYFVP